MKKSSGIILIGLVLLISACGQETVRQAGNTSTQTEEINSESDTTVGNTDVNQDEDEQPLEAPSREEVHEKRASCLEQMTAEDIAFMTENIKADNLMLENAYFYDNIFERLSDPEALDWNYIDKNGEIIVGYAFEEGEEYQESSGLSYEEYAEKYGAPVVTNNTHDAASFIKMMEKIKSTIHNECFKKDFDNLIENMKQAKNTHDVKYVENVYYILHDMDYYLLRYAPDDVGIYVQDKGTINKYYGVLEVYKSDVK